MRLLELDIESSPNEAYVWGNKPKWIPAKQMKETSRVLCYAYRWVGETRVMLEAEWTSNSGYQHIFLLHKLLDEADAVITYNGKRFDIPVVNKEFLEHGLRPPSPYAHIDLYQTVKKNFRFTHNGLNDVCQQLGIGKKVKHEGFELWIKVMEGDEAARKRMERYNKQDVRLLGRLYSRLLPWIQPHPNHNLFVDDNDPRCTNCGSKHIHRKGVERTTTQIYPRYSCQACGKPQRGRNTLVPPEKRPNILVGLNA